MDRKAARQTQTDRQIDRQTDRQTDRRSGLLWSDAADAG